MNYLDFFGDYFYLKDGHWHLEEGLAGYPSLNNRCIMICK